MSIPAKSPAEDAPAAPLSVEAARRAMLGQLPRMDSESIGVDGGAVHRVLATDLVAQVLLPPWNNSAMDGYAVRAEELTQLPLRLPVRGEMAAGMAPGSVTLLPGSCAKVMTGAPLPEGADSVVPYEWTDRGAQEVLIRERPALGHAVRRAGEDISPGDLILPQGHRLRPTDLASVAASGLASVLVAQRPRVAVVTTGDEIRPAGTQLGPGQIYDTAGPALEAMVASAGGEVVLRMRVGDDPEAVEGVLTEAAAGSDLLVTVGGVSVGDHDHVRATVERRGRLRLWRVAMRPGRPIAFGELFDTVFLGLPGNPVSATVTFLLFGIPCLLTMQGARLVGPPLQLGQLLEEVEKPAGLETYHRAVTTSRPGQLPGVRPLPGQSSGATSSLARADVLLVLPAPGTRLPKGRIVEMIPL